MKIRVSTYDGEVDLIAILPNTYILCETESDFVVWSYRNKPFGSIQCNCGNYFPKFNYTYEQVVALVQEKYGVVISSRE